MKKVTLKSGLLIGDVNHPEGALVELSDQRAAELVRLGHAAPHDGPDDAEVANPGRNPLEDSISPEPPAVAPEMDAGLNLDAIKKPARSRPAKSE